jgi:hypothetical protein
MQIVGSHQAVTAIVPRPYQDEDGQSRDLPTSDDLSGDGTAGILHHLGKREAAGVGSLLYAAHVCSGKDFHSSL